MPIVRNFNLFLHAGHSTSLVIHANQYDQGEQWVFTLYDDNGTQYIPSTGAIVGVKSDGLGIINTGSVVDGNVVINETQQMTAAVGEAVFELMIDSQTHGTANFVVLVEEKPGNNADLSESDLSLLQEAIDATSPLPTGGSVGQVLTKTANGSAWSDAGTPTQEQVADAVSDWADEHITVTTGVVIDTSLSVAGAAADAKKTGDEITDLKSIIQPLCVYPQNPVLGTGGNMTPNNRIRFDRIPVGSGSKVILTSSAYSIWCVVYSTATGTTVLEQSSAWETGKVTHNINSDGYLLIEGARSNRNLAFDSANDMDGLVYVVSPVLLDKPDVITYTHLDAELKNAIDSIDESADNRLENARHTRNTTNSPLTILHMSDIHYDWEAKNRIISEGNLYGTNIDEYICTGDMVANVGGSIASWWPSKVLTCIGNHDTATYSNGAYNWTALTMAERDQYYIAPYESNWDVIHTSGTSYYYKDYADSKVRLIVMDGMLYTNAGSEATTQTAWLEGLLSSAITAGLHVLIAIHSPHGGAKAVDCSFSKYGQVDMPTYSDCNTPQIVIDTVAAKISAGLHFVGYLVGHTHQDNIWDAEGDGTQLMYCITCANVKQQAQWINSDQHRSESQDAFNLVTIDTNHSLIKLVRGGGADIDDHMRPRKQICIDYANGVVVSEAENANGVYF